jgi:cephalosporin hydroxylase
VDAVNPSVARWMQPDRPAYRGIYMQQLEPDLERYTEIINELRPPFIVEVGRAEGGTTALLADRLGDVRPDGLVISIDVLEPARMPPTRSRVLYLTTDSTSDEAVAWVYKAAVGNRGMVLLDGDHSSAHVTQELDLYVDVADYLVVEDTIMRDLGDKDGPHLALDAWLPNHPEFTVDPDPTLTQHPGGWLRRTHG